MSDQRKNFLARQVGGTRLNNSTRNCLLLRVRASQKRYLAIRTGKMRKSTRTRILRRSSANDYARRDLDAHLDARAQRVEALMKQVRSYSGTGQAANRNNTRYYPIVRPIAGRRT